MCRLSRSADKLDTKNVAHNYDHRIIFRTKNILIGESQPLGASQIVISRKECKTTEKMAVLMYSLCFLAWDVFLKQLGDWSQLQASGQLSDAESKDIGRVNSIRSDSANKASSSAFDTASDYAQKSNSRDNAASAADKAAKKASAAAKSNLVR